MKFKHYSKLRIIRYSMVGTSFWQPLTSPCLHSREVALSLHLFYDSNYLYIHPSEKLGDFCVFHYYNLYQRMKIYANLFNFIIIYQYFNSPLLYLCLTNLNLLISQNDSEGPLFVCESLGILTLIFRHS